MNVHPIAYILFSLLILIAGCKKDDKNPVATDSGRIAGKIKLHDEFGIELSEHGNMQVSVQSGESGVTGSTGDFEIVELAEGMYNLSYEKSGFGTFRKFNIEVTASSNGTILNGTDLLGAKSTTVITGLTAVLNTNDSTYTIGCNVSPTPDATHQRAFRLFFSKTNDVSSSDYLYTPSSKWISTTATGNITGFQRQNLYSNGFISGDSVYVVAFGESILTNTYTVPGETKKVYPNLNVGTPSNIVGFILQ